jgi:hypothetical protein
MTLHLEERKGMTIYIECHPERSAAKMPAPGRGEARSEELVLNEEKEPR